jgi:kinesin family protein C2/C3
VRPFLSDEPGRPTTVDYIGENGEIVLVNPSQQGGKDSRKAFSFNKVFGTMASQGTAAFSMVLVVLKVKKEFKPTS